MRDYCYICNKNHYLVYLEQAGMLSLLRETFFFNQMRVHYPILVSKESDFFIKPYTFEIGGNKKGKKQIEEVKEGRIVKDDIETGHGIVLPLWYFGMNY